MWVRVGEQLLQLASDAQRPAVEAILARTREQRLRVLVAGEAKRGKSTLLNRLLGRDLLPTGVLPVTAVSTTVRYGDADELRVRYLEGRLETRSLDEIAKYVTERANPENRLGVADVEAVLAGGRLARHPVELVDTPGTGTVFEHNTAAAQQAYATLDAVVLVVTASPPMSAAERALLRDVSGHAVRTFVVVNKADQLTADELAEAVEFTAALAGEQVYPMSARDADAGFEAFRTAFEQYLTDRAGQDAARAVRGHLLRLAEGMRDETAVELRAVELARGEGRTRLVTFGEQLGQLATRAAELADRCHTTERRLRRELGEQAHALTRKLVPEAQDAASAACYEAADLGPLEIEQRGREAVERTVGGAVLDWRDARAQQMEQQLAGLLETIEADRARHLDTLRQAARDELGLALGTGIEPLPLQPGRLFWLAFNPPPAIELVPGAQLLRAHGPGATRRARQRVLADISEVTDRQVGRARGDLQQRLGETVRQLVAALQLHHADTLSRLHDALARASEAGQQDTAHADAEAARLRDRLAQLDDVLVDLSAAGSVPNTPRYTSAP